MEWKYKVIFLMLLLCLLKYENLSAQYCLSIRYDDNGNRMEKLVTRNAKDYENLDENDIMNLEVSEDSFDDNVLVYPNPNKGLINIQLYRENEQDVIIYELYNNLGVLIKTEQFTNSIRVDISDNAAGIYLLKIITDEMMLNKIVVKL